MGPDDVKGDVADTVGDIAMGDRTLCLSAEGNVSPLAPPDGSNGLDDGRSAPPVAVYVGPLANTCRAMEDDEGTVNRGSTGANVIPAQQSAGLYPLFYCGNAGLGW